ncbi:MAG: rhomboid family intramembrane serine protease [Cellvibrionaceae bacterium]
MIKDFRVLGFLLALMIGVHVLNLLTQNSLLAFGISPRRLSSLPNIFLAPFLHGSGTHLLNNLTGLVIFGGLCLLRSRQFFVYSSVYIIIVGGILVWLFGRSHIHIGASGWVFGLWAVCICSAFLEKSFLNILIAFFVIAFYGGMIYGLFPSSPRISFESHIFGAVAGICSLFFQSNWLQKIFKK